MGFSRHLIWIAFLLMSMSASRAGTWQVGGAAPDFISIQAALSDSRVVGGDTILAHTGVYGPISVPSGKSVRIQGAPGETVVINSTGASAVAMISEQVTFQNLTFTRDVPGSGIVLQGAGSGSTFESCVIGPIAGHGIMVNSSGSTLTLTGCSFTGIAPGYWALRNGGRNGYSLSDCSFGSATSQVSAIYAGNGPDLGSVYLLDRCSFYPAPTAQNLIHADGEDGSLFRFTNCLFISDNIGFAHVIRSYQRAHTWQFIHCTMTETAGQAYRQFIFLGYGPANGGVGNAANGSYEFQNCLFNWPASSYSWILSAQNGADLIPAQAVKAGTILFHLGSERLESQNDALAGKVDQAIFDDAKVTSDGWHLTSASPALGRAADFGVADDLDHDPRPSPAGTLPDLGCDEETATTPSPPLPPVVFECNTFRLEFAANGRPNSLFYKPAGRELCAGGAGFEAYNDGPTVALTKLSKTPEGKLLAASADGSRSVLFDVVPRDRHIAFRIEQLTGFPTGSNVKLRFTLNTTVSGTTAGAIPAIYGGGVGIGVVSLDWMTSTSPAFVVDWSYLWHRADLPSDPLGGFAVFACAEDQTLETVGQIELAEGLPHPLNQGEWAKIKNDTARLSQMWMVYNTPEERDRAVAYVEESGVGMFYLPQSIWEGSSAYQINSSRWPGGKADLRAFSDELRGKGILLGIHTGSASLWRSDTSYVSPVPDDRLAEWGRGSLAQPVSASGSTIFFTPDAGVVYPTIDPVNLYGLRPPTYDRIWGFKYFRIGNELVKAASVDSSVIPWKLQGCERGQQGTVAAAHAAGGVVRGMLSAYDLLAVDPNSTLLDELATKMAGVVNDCRIARVSFDALETVDHAGSWAKNKFLMLASQKFDHYVASESSSGIPPYEWHVHSYANVGEGMHHYPKPYVEGYLLGSVKWSNESFCPAAMGSYTFRLDGPAQHASTPDEWEWWLAKTAAYDACYFFETALDFFDNHGQTHEILALSRKWEKARLAHAFNATQREQMKEYGMSFRLSSADDGETTWSVTPVKIEPNFIKPVTTLSIGNPFGTQPAWIEARVLPSFDQDSISNVSLMPPDMTSLSVDSGLTVTQSGGSLTFASGSRTAVRANWTLPTELDLSAKRGLGLKIKGNGQGGLFFVEYREASVGFTRHYTIRNDTTAERTIEIPSYEVSNYQDLDHLYDLWGGEAAWYSIKLGFNYHRIASVRFGLIDVPAGSTASVTVEGIKALAENPVALTNLVVSNAAGELAFHGNVPAGHYLVYEGGNSAQVLDPNRHPVATLPVTSTNWAIPAGSSLVSVSCESDTKPWLKLLFKTLGESFPIPNPYLIQTNSAFSRWLDYEDDSG